MDALSLFVHGVIPGMPRTAEPTNQSSERASEREAFHFSIPHPITELPFDALPLSLFSSSIFLRFWRVTVMFVADFVSLFGAPSERRALHSYRADVRHAPIWALSLSLLITFGMALIVFGVLSELSVRWRK